MEFKFRVWDGSEYVALSTALKREIIGTQYDFCAYEKVITFNEIETFYENVVLEQYTGSKDKNGKDSYFNDRCNYEYYIFTSANPESTPNKYEGTGVIVFIEGAFMIKPDGKENPIPLHYAELSFEIIGTIHDKEAPCDNSK